MNTGNRIPTAFLLCLAALVTACSEENDDEQTALEGDWSSQCIATITGFTSNTIPARRLQYSFSENNLTLDVLEYSNDKCTSLATTGNSDSIFAAPFSPFSSFTIGDEFTLSTGDTVTEINIKLEDSSVIKNIFLLQNDTLYFGATDINCTLTATNTSELQVCYDIRPDSINFTTAYTKDD